MSTKFIVLAVIGLFLFSCREPSVVPKISDEEQSIAMLKTLYSGAPTLIKDNILITGTVISSDVEDNFYNTLVIEDSSGGIEIKLGKDQIFKQFKIHTRVTARCQGLWLGSYGGTLQLGGEPTERFETEPLTENQINEHLVSDKTFYGEILPRELRISELSARDISSFVSFSDVRFITEEQGLSWAEADAATDRHIVDNQGHTLIVRTSNYATFAHRVLPSGSGRIEGVLGVFDDEYQLVVTDAMKFFTDF